MKLLGFRTDGFTIDAKLIALASKRPYSPNTNHLSEAGYDLPNPVKGGVDVIHQPRGVYRITEKRYDNYPVDESDASSINLSVVDVGVKKPVCVRYVDLDKAGDATTIKDNSSVWELTASQYRNMSGYDIVRERDQLRRYHNKKYREALAEICQLPKKSSQPGAITAYSAIVAKHLGVLLKEKLHRQRAKARRVHQKKLQSALDRIGDMIARYGKEDGKKRVVIYGDGHFKPPKKGISVPWKKIAHNVACKSLTFATSEHRSSCGCPACEEGEMKDIQKGSRMRRCSNNNTNSLIPDSSCCVFSTLTIDRDQVATISLGRIGHDALLHQTRPKQFCNRQRPVSEDAVQRSSRNKRRALSKVRSKDGIASDHS